MVIYMTFNNLALNNILIKAVSTSNEVDIVKLAEIYVWFITMGIIAVIIIKLMEKKDLI